MPPDLDTAILCHYAGICQSFIDTLFGTAFYPQVINFVPEVSPKTHRTVELQLDLIKIFQLQFEKEKLALKLHQQIAGMTLDYFLGDKFSKLSKEEELHIQTVEKILSRLS